MQIISFVGVSYIFDWVLLRFYAFSFVSQPQWLVVGNDRKDISLKNKVSAEK